MSGVAGAPHITEPTPLQAGVHGLCPRCGAKTLFDGLARFALKCRACGLNYQGFNVGDGPAGFLTLALGALITGLAISVELAFEPPFWLHILLWPPITIGGVILSLRVAKGMLLSLEYRNGAREGRIRDDQP